MREREQKDMRACAQRPANCRALVPAAYAFNQDFTGTALDGGGQGILVEGGDQDTSENVKFLFLVKKSFS